MNKGCTNNMFAPLEYFEDLYAFVLLDGDFII